MRYDRERVEKILEEMLLQARSRGIYQTKAPTDALEKLIGEVRKEAIEYTWTEACSQYDRGMDPRNYTISILIPKATADLNPERT